MIHLTYKCTGKRGMLLLLKAFPDNPHEVDKGFENEKEKQRRKRKRIRERKGKREQIETLMRQKKKKQIEGYISIV